MADNSRNTKDSQDNDDERPVRENEYMFMTNIITPAKFRTKYIKLLKSFTMDAQVPFQRIIIAVALGLLALIAAVSFIMNDAQRTSYVVLPVIIILGGLILLIINYMISSRNKSLLLSTIILLRNTVTEIVRKKGKAATDLHSIGISDITPNGLIKFDEGDIGIMYHVEGNLSQSTLPRVADSTAISKAQYLVARSATSQERLITSIHEVDVRQQLHNLERYHQEAAERIRQNRAGENNEAKIKNDEWCEAMASMNYRYIKDNMEHKEYNIIQYIILRDVSAKALKKTKQIFENSVRNGMLSYATELKSTKLICDALAPISLISKKGARDYVQTHKDNAQRTRQ